MKRWLKNSQYITGMSKVQSVGLFWYITDTDEILSFPYDPDQHISALSKNGLTYTHKKLWPEISGKYRNKPYNYYPRGRVEIDNKGRSVVYMNPNIPESAIDTLRKDFGVSNDRIVIKYDNSNHYKCYLDDEWEPDR